MSDLAADHQPTLVAATVVRVTATGFEAPLVLAAVRHEGRLITARLGADPEELPRPGTPVTVSGSDVTGWTATLV